MLDLCLLSAPALLGPGIANAIEVRRPEVREFVAMMAHDHGFNRSALTRLLKSAKTQPSIIAAMSRPAEKAKLWYEYRQIFITPGRIREGIAFWRAHSDELARASALSGVDPQYIVAILGVETLYGRQNGRYRVLDALSTLAFDYPPRSKFFLGELEQFMLLTREAHIDPKSAGGSYAGAMGAPQFMPSSYRRFGVDASGDGRVDLWKNWMDIFASVGNYFKENGWRSGEPAMSDAQIDSLQIDPGEGRQLALNETVASLKGAGVRFETALAEDAPALLIAVDRPDGIAWRVGYNNFYVITRYNRSALYAMAAIELAGELKRQIELEPEPRPDAAPDASLISVLPP